jgi:alanyl-tRNA synthetase
MPSTRRLYYTDATVRAFDATVQSCVAAGAGFEVVLDATAFYPTSGGQPFDTGRLGGVEVVDVVDRDDGAVVHVVTGTMPAGVRVVGEIDWGRRVDHMQQHTGQHILSAAFDRLAGARTVSFHLGKELSTIDLGRDLTSEEIAAAESEANRIVWEDRPVDVRFVTAEEAAHLPLRKEPSRTGELRIVEVEGFDLSACGGTHVSRTGMIGVIAVTAWERFKGGVRVSFVCGGRALDAHRRLRDIVTAAGRVLSVTPGELTGQIERLQQQARALERDVEGLLSQLYRYQAVEYREQAETIGTHRGVLRAEPSTDAAGLRALAQRVVAEPGYMAVLVGAGAPAPVVIARSAGVEIDAAALLKEVLSAFGGRGGGKPDLAQGGVTAPASEVVAFLRQRLIS